MVIGVLEESGIPAGRRPVRGGRASYDALERQVKGEGAETTKARRGNVAKNFLSTGLPNTRGVVVSQH